MTKRPERPATPRRGGPVQRLLRPAVLILNRLRYAHKFTLIAILVLVPLAIVTWLQIAGTTNDVVFNRKERAGVEYVSALRDLRDALQRFGIAQELAAGAAAGASEDLKQALAKVDAAVAGIDEVERRHGASLETSAPWATLEQEWSVLRQQQLAPEAAAAARAKLQGLLVGLALQVGVTSNLTLDPDADSYWLQDATVLTLGRLTDVVHRSALLGLRVSRAGVQTQADLVEMAGLYRAGDDQLRDFVDNNMKTAFQSNPSRTVRPALELDLQKTDNVVSAYFKWVREQLLGESAAKVPAAELRTLSLAALDQLYVLQHKIAPVLDDLIATRVRTYERNRNLGLLGALLALALLLYGFGGLYSSVQTSVVSLGEATQRMIAGSEETFALESRDEVGQIAESYNAINRALLEARTLRARVERENQELQGNIMNLLDVVSEAADGALGVRAVVTSGAMGNVADAFNQMIESWQELVSEIQGLFRRTNEAIGAIQASSEQMAAGATDQVQGIVTASASVRDVSDGITRVSQAAGNASSAAQRTQESAAAGAHSVEQVVRGMDGLRGSVQAGAKKIKALGDRSMEITSIVGTIAKISDQTNMLALNAAIEAARAGEHGRGFSVVADQVRQLAERTAAATHEIEALVRAIQTETNESVEAIEQQTTVVEAESRVVGSAGDALTRIQEMSNQSTTLIAQIDTIAREQVDGVVSVARVMEQVSEIARRTQASAEESVRNTSGLADLAGQLQQRVNRFRI